MLCQTQKQILGAGVDPSVLQVVFCLRPYRIIRRLQGLQGLCQLIIGIRSKDGRHIDGQIGESNYLSD